MDRQRPGDVIDGFRLEEPLHQGGMATLWRVTHADRTTPLLMKIPLLDPDEGSGVIVGFEVEQAILPRLSGPHVPAFVAAAFSHPPWIVMEHVEGRPLSALMEAGRLPAGQVAALGAALARALHDLHAQSVIHHDVKPANVLIRPDGEAVLVDFGLARHEQLPDLLAEEATVPVGTGIYMAPEEVLRDRSDPRSDIFASGVILYEMITGARPFGTPETLRQMRRRLHETPPRPRSLNPDCPEWLEEVILRCLAVEPADRIQTAAQLAFALTHPDSVGTPSRSERPDRQGFVASLRRRLSAQVHSARPSQSISGILANAPLLMVAVDLSAEMSEIAETLRRSLRRLLESHPNARVTCVNVVRVSRVKIDTLEDEQGHNLWVSRLVELKSWARPLDIGPERITHHVLAHVDPAQAILDFANANRVDHILMGARGSSALRRYLGSVSSKVVAEAPCTVTIVRVKPLASVFAAVEAEAG